MFVMTWRPQSRRQGYFHPQQSLGDVGIPVGSRSGPHVMGSGARFPEVPATLSPFNFQGFFRPWRKRAATRHLSTRMGLGSHTRREGGKWEKLIFGEVYQILKEMERPGDLLNADKCVGWQCSPANRWIIKPQRQQTGLDSDDPQGVLFSPLRQNFCL